jgi:Rrf2 family nitric oxide-sensitive transcriptional repressor
LEDDKYCSRFATDNCPVRSFYVNLQSVWEKNLHSISILDLMNK